MIKKITELFLPEGILDYFELTRVETTQENHNLYLEEKNIHPKEYEREKLISKGFYDQVKIQDHPIRGKSCFLFVKRRRWLNENTGIVVFRDWELVAKGTRMTKEFASFLKGAHRHTTS